jgi:phosphatidylglycerophosphatase A
MSQTIQKKVNGEGGLEACVKGAASFFYIGYLPWMPGTWGTIAALPIAWFLNENLVWIALGLSLVGLLICKPAEKAFNAKDPSRFVLDEVAGMALAVLWLPKTIFIYAIGFILFRILDIWKPGPIRWIQDSKTPTSIMWDDLLAGAAVNIILQIVVRI